MYLDKYCIILLVNWWWDSIVHVVVLCEKAQDKAKIKNKLSPVSGQKA